MCGKSGKVGRYSFGDNFFIREQNSMKTLHVRGEVITIRLEKESNTGYFFRKFSKPKRKMGYEINHLLKSEFHRISCCSGGL